MLLALTEEAGIKGLRQPEMEAFCRLVSSRLSQLAAALEKRASSLSWNFHLFFS